MSKPINIPSARASRSRHEVELFSPEDGPYFGFIEVLEDGSVFWAVSSGQGRFIEIGQRRTLPALAFIVEKDRISRRITIEVASPTLNQSLHRAVLNNAPSDVSSALDFEALLKNYDALKVHLGRVEAHQPHSELAAELRLLVVDLLLEKGLYDGIGMEGFRQHQVACTSLVRDIHQRNVDLGLDDIQDWFSLGLVPDEINERYMEALNTRYAELARAGDLHGLQNLCEPIVRSGEIELRYNPSLLLEVLDNGDLELYQYMLALVDRTREELDDRTEEDVSDITFDPFHVAIRLGQIDLVQSFVREHAYFEGRATDHPVPGYHGQLLTPLTSAVCWRQPDIVRLLLKSGPLYKSSYPQAVALALSSELQDMLAALSAESTIPASSVSSTVFTSGQSATSSGKTCISPGVPLSYIPTPYSLGLVPSDDVMQDSDMSGNLEQACQDVEATSSMEHNLVQDSVDPQNLVFDHSTDCNQNNLSPPPQRTEQVSASPLPSASMADFEPVQKDSSDVAHPFMRQRASHDTKRKAGRVLVQRLETKYVKLRTLCLGRRDDGAYDKLLRRMAGMEDVWETGIRVFKGIYRNRSPEDLGEVLCCLLVSDAVCNFVSGHDDRLHAQFMGDLWRWKTVLCNEERQMFDQVALVVWDVNPHDTSEYNDTASDDGGFQEVLQELVSIDSLPFMLRQKTDRRGSRLRSIYGRKDKHKRQLQSFLTNPEDVLWNLDSIPFSGSIFGQSVGTLDAGEENNINLGDFIYLDALGMDGMDIDAPSPPKSVPLLGSRVAWKDVKPVVALLLASIAFSFVLSLIIDGFDQARGPFDPFLRTIPALQENYKVFGDFFKFQEPEAPPSHGSNDVQFSCSSSSQSVRISKMKECTSIPARRVSSRHGDARPRMRRLSIRGSIGSPGSIISMSTDLSSTDTAHSPERLRCQSLGCTKTFSSVSNRNKHMREGCALRDKRVGGYPCRNANCVKVLTTKWYRNTHEQTRCRFR